ncbi:DUF5667 domain-containing protein [Kitasatospora sp. NPDC059577]|uniref:DUF5667 domain-containing protein n=1 Tax=Kitasatospora sp. NPDC059577 TaxID=3346873 RepID=UPI00367A8D3F
MTANVLEHRRAKAFAEALEAHRTEQRAATDAESANTAGTGSGSAAMAELVGLTDVLGALPGPVLDREVRTVQRAQLMAAFEQALAGGPGAAVPRQRRHRAIRTAPRGRWSRRFAIGGLVAGLAVGSLAGAAAASTGAVPGDTLYGLKRGLEGLRLDFAGSDSERGELLLDNAATRLGEAKVLVGRTGPAGGLSPATVEQVRRALDDMHADALKGRELLRSVYRSNGSLDPMRALAGFAHDEDGRWTELQGKLPVQLTQQASLVNQLFDDISEDVAPLRLAQPPRQERWHGRPRSGRRLLRLDRRRPGRCPGRGFRCDPGRRAGPRRRRHRRQPPRCHRPRPGRPRRRRDRRQRQGRGPAQRPAHQCPGRGERAGR